MLSELLQKPQMVALRMFGGGSSSGDSAQGISLSSTYCVKTRFDVVP